MVIRNKIANKILTASKNNKLTQKQIKISMIKTYLIQDIYLQNKRQDIIEGKIEIT